MTIDEYNKSEDHMKKNLFLASISIFVISCATGSGVNSFSNKIFFDNKWDGTTSSSTIRNNITREVGGGLSGIQYVAEIYPITGALIEAEVTESGKKAMDSSDQISSAIAKRKSDFKGTCFSFVLNAPTIEEGYFKQYRVKYESSNGELSELELQNVKGVESVPSPGPGTFPWYNHSFVCSKSSLNLTNGFTLHIIPKTDWKTPSKLIWKIK